jgi:hypothetical protein
MIQQLFGVGFGLMLLLEGIEHVLVELGVL